MRALAAALALALTGLAPTASAGHIDTGAFRVGCPFSESEWDEGVYDCGGRIPSIQEPSFDDGAWLEDGAVVIGVTKGATAKAYPISILDWHEIVNDEIEGDRIVVSYCPLCGSSVVYERVVNGVELHFHVSGYLFHSDLVMVDEETHSLWPQIEGEAARGDLHGTLLELYPSDTTSWGEWRERHPDTLVLARPRCGDGSTDNQAGCRGEFQRSYTSYPYGSYQTNEDIGISGQRRADIQGLHPKDMVLGVTAGDARKAYPFALVAEAGAINDEIDTIPVVVTWTGSDGHAFLRPDGITFALEEEGRTLVSERGERYSAVTGESLDGEAPLRELDALDLFWFAWADHHPDTQLYTESGETVEVVHQPTTRSTPGFATYLVLMALVAAMALTRRSRRRR